MPLVFAARGVVDNNALVDVTVGNEDLVCFRLDVEVRRTPEVFRIVAPLVYPGLSNGEHVLAVLRELHHVHAGTRAHPHEAVVVDVDAVLLIEPRITVTGPAPGSKHLAVLIQFKHGRRGHATIRDWRLDRSANLLRGETGGHVDHPQMVVVVHEQSADITEDPIVRQGRGPRGIHLVDRQLIGRRRSRSRLRIRALRECDCRHEQPGYEEGKHARHDADYRLSSRPARLPSVVRPPMNRREMNCR